MWLWKLCNISNWSLFEVGCWSLVRSLMLMFRQNCQATVCSSLWKGWLLSHTQKLWKSCVLWLLSYVSRSDQTWHKTLLPINISLSFINDLIPCHDPALMPKWPQMVNITCFDNFWPFLAYLLHPFGPFSDKTCLFASNTRNACQSKCFWEKIKFCLE